MKNIFSVRDSLLARKGYYFKREETPDIGTDEVDFILKAETNETLERIEARINMIANCILFFTILQIISIVLGVIVFLSQL